MLLDCISQVTETKDKFKGLPLGARAVQIADGTTSNYFLTTFGRSPRETVCACDVKMEPTLSQALHLLNGSTVEDKVKSGGVVKRQMDAKKSDEQIFEALYVRALSRKPAKEETQGFEGIGHGRPQSPTGSRGRFLGGPQFTGVPVQPLSRTSRLSGQPESTLMNRLLLQSFGFWAAIIACVWVGPSLAADAKPEAKTTYTDHVRPYPAGVLFLLPQPEQGPERSEGRQL